MTPNDSVKLSAEQRAEKIVRDFCGFGWACKELPADTQNCVNQIAAQIEEAERGAVDKHIGNAGKHDIREAVATAVSIADLLWQIMHSTPVTLMPADHRDWLGKELYEEGKKLEDKPYKVGYAEGFRAGMDKGAKNAQQSFKSMMKEHGSNQFIRGCKEGFKDAREKAKGIADKVALDDDTTICRCDLIAKRIERMEA